MIKKLKSEIAASIKSRKINVFILFLLLAFIILIFTKLSKEYTNTLQFKIDKINVPQENVILNDSNTVLNITLKTHGFKWLKYYFSKPKITIDFEKDVSKKGSAFVWSKDKAYLFETSQFGKQVKLLNISPDTLFFKFDVNSVKKVPVILNASIEFSQGFDVLKGFKMEPDSIDVIGPNILVSKIDSVLTTEIEMDDVKSDIFEQVNIKLPENNDNLKFSNTSVVLKAKVEKFTEGTLKVPVILKNVPQDLKLKYFPKTVTVAYYTSLDNFKAIRAKDFKVACDFSKITEDQSFLVPEVIMFPETAKRVKLNEQHIEFIIIE